MTLTKLRDKESIDDILDGASPVAFLFDRVKRHLSAINQSEFPCDLPPFEAFIRGCMRREPTDIIDGECRDSLTMSAAIQAVISGHDLTATMTSL